MFKLDTKIVLDKALIDAPDLTDRFTPDELAKLGEHVYEGYSHDRQSRSKWERRTQAAMDLALQVQKDKSFPWPNSSNIAFPLITIGALQFHSRAYPAIIPGNDVVKCRVIGPDDTGAKTQRANRIATYMSWQNMEEDKAWEEQKDRLLINLPIVGTVFTKSYYDGDKGHNVAETVLAQDLVLNYWAKSVEDCPRKTHVIPLFRNEIHARIKRGMFRDISEEKWYGTPPAAQAGQDTSTPKIDNRQGITPPQADEATPFISLEQHVDLDLDQDGYAEPYIITIEESSKCVLRLVAGFDQETDVERNNKGEVIQVRRTEYFTKYEFIPSPDGGVYGVGFGVLLGPLNEATNSIINQLVDAGTMQTTKGGFLGRGAKVRGGVYTFSPLEWKRVDSTGDDLRKNIVPLEVGEPSTVLFQLLNLLINYVQRVNGTTDPMVGEPTGQNTPAETSRAMIQEGSRVYSAVFKRIWRGMKEEFKKGYILNGIYMPQRKMFGTGFVVLRADFLGNPDEVCPAADPNLTSESMILQQAVALKQSAASTPGYDLEAVEKRWLKALKVDNPDEVYPGVAKTGQKEDVKVTIAKMKHATEMAWLDMEKQNFIIQMQETVRMDTATIAQIEAEIADMQQTQVGDAQDRRISMLNNILGMLKTKTEVTTKKLDVMMKALEVRRAQVESQSADAGGMGGLAGAPGDGGSASGAGKSAAGA